MIEVDELGRLKDSEKFIEQGTGKGNKLYFWMVVVHAPRIPVTCYTTDVFAHG